MSTHEKADYQILIDSASQYILAHAASAGLQIRPPVWDDGAPIMTDSTHRVRIETPDAHAILRIPHQWLLPDSEGHNRFRTDVEAAIAKLKAPRR